MNSIRPVATVAVLAVIGVGLYLVINTSDPIPPEDAADAMLDLPQIEGDLAGLVDEGTLQSGPESHAEEPYPTGGEMPAAPAWPSSQESLPPSWPADQQGPPSLPEDALPEDPTAGALPHSAEASMQSQSGDAGSTYGSDANAFSAQIQSQIQRDSGPAMVENPHVAATPHGQADWGDIPPAHAAEGLTNVLPRAPSPPSYGSVPTEDPSGGESSGYSHQTLPGGATLPPIGDIPAGGSTPFSIAWSAAEEVLQRGELSQALRMLSEFYGDPHLTPEEADQLQELLSQLAGTVIYSKSHELDEPYRVGPGESLEEIARRYEVTPELLAKINGISDPSTLSPGTELKVVRGPFHAVIDETAIRLVLQGRYAGRFAAEGPAGWPASSWTVQQKVPAAGASASSALHGGKHLVLTPTDPQAQATPVTIVAADDADGPAQPVVRVSAQDLGDLYDILTIGSRVTVRR